MPRAESVTVPLYRFTDGALFLTPYRGTLSRLRGEQTDPESKRLIDFKLHRRGSGRFAGIVEAVRAHVGAEAVVAVPGSSVHRNAVQAIVDDEAPVALVPRFARANRHNAKDVLDAGQEQERLSVEWRVPKRRLGRVLLLDDLSTSGRTLKVYESILKAEGVASEVVRFSLGAVTTSRRFKRVCDLEFSPLPDLPDATLTGPDAPEGKPSPALERLREIRADIAAMELAKLREELLPRDSVHVAFGEVVAIVRAGLLGLPNWASVNLANLPPDKIEVATRSWAYRLAEDFQTRCGEVRLTAPGGTARAVDRVKAKAPQRPVARVKATSTKGGRGDAKATKARVRHT